MAVSWTWLLSACPWCSITHMYRVFASASAVQQSSGIPWSLRCLGPNLCLVSPPLGWSGSAVAQAHPCTYVQEMHSLVLSWLLPDAPAADTHTCLSRPSLVCLVCRLPCFTLCVNKFSSTSSALDPSNAPATDTQLPTSHPSQPPSLCTAGDWTTVRLPWHSFVPVKRAQSDPTEGPLDPHSVSKMGLVLSRFEFNKMPNPCYKPGECQVGCSHHCLGCAP